MKKFWSRDMGKQTAISAKLETNVTLLEQANVELVRVATKLSEKLEAYTDDDRT